MLEVLGLSSRALVLSLAATLSLPGCFVSLDLSYCSCSCTDGWTCDLVMQMCIQGAIDAVTSFDTSARDVGSNDAVMMDAVMIDATMIDVARVDDTGVDDTGVDAARAQDAGIDVGIDASYDVATNVDAATVCTARVCDDFESALTNRIPFWQWTIGVVSRSTTLAYGGVASGHFSAPAIGPGDRQQVVGVNLSNTIIEVWLRFWAYVSSTSLSNNIGIASLAEAFGANDSILLNDHGWAMYV